MKKLFSFLLFFQLSPILSMHNLVVVFGQKYKAMQENWLKKLEEKKQKKLNEELWATCLNRKGWRDNKAACAKKVQILLRQGADINYCSFKHDKRTILHHAACQLALRHLCNFLLSLPDIDVNARDREGETPLFFAVLTCNVSALNWLLAHKKINLNARDNKGLGVFEYAVLFAKLEIIKILIDHLDLVDANLYMNDLESYLKYLKNKNYLVFSTYFDLRKDIHKDLKKIFIFYQIYKKDPVQAIMVAEKSEYQALQYRFIRRFFSEITFPNKNREPSDYKCFLRLYTESYKKKRVQGLKKVLSKYYYNCSDRERHCLSTLGFPLTGDEWSFKENLLEQALYPKNPDVFIL